MQDASAETGDGFTMLEIRNERLAQGFVRLFDILWDGASQFEEAV